MSAHGKDPQPSTTAVLIAWVVLEYQMPRAKPTCENVYLPQGILIYKALLCILVRCCLPSALWILKCKIFRSSELSCNIFQRFEWRGYSQKDLVQVCRVHTNSELSLVRDNDHLAAELVSLVDSLDGTLLLHAVNHAANDVWYRSYRWFIWCILGHYTDHRHTYAVLAHAFDDIQQFARVSAKNRE